MERRLLAIDDEPRFADMVCSVARTCGYAAEAVSSPLDVRKALATKEPFCIVLDLQMPQCDGIDMMHVLAEERCRARIIIASGFDPKVIESARLVGIELGLDVAGILRKPFHIADLRQLLDTLTMTEEGFTVADFEKAIVNKEFSLLFQPKVPLDTASAQPDRPRVSFEALLRWRHPTRGVVEPSKFIPAFEAMGVMDTLTSAVIDLAVGQLSRWQAASASSISVAINVSAQNLDSGDFVDQLSQRCAAAALAPESVAVELTETAAMRTPVRAMEMLTRLRLKGFHLSLDDFGTGYSSLVQLQRLPFSELKIDRAFVLGCHASNQSRIIVKTMIDLAHNLGLVAVAEGVDCADHIRVLQQLGCDIVQGYFIGRPMTAEAATEWMKDATSERRHAKAEVA